MLGLNPLSGVKDIISLELVSVVYAELQWSYEKEYDIKLKTNGTLYLLLHSLKWISERLVAQCPVNFIQ